MWKSEPVRYNIVLQTFVCLYVCSILKHQLNTDMLNKNGTCISNAVSVPFRKCSI